MILYANTFFWWQITKQRIVGTGQKIFGNFVLAFPFVYLLLHKNTNCLVGLLQTIRISYSTALPYLKIQDRNPILIAGIFKFRVIRVTTVRWLGQNCLLRFRVWWSTKIKHLIHRIKGPIFETTESTVDKKRYLLSIPSLICSWRRLALRPSTNCRWSYQFHRPNWVLLFEMDPVGIFPGNSWILENN